MSGDSLTIGRDLLLAVYREARRSFPRECCGWLTGPAQGAVVVSALRRCDNVQESGAHPTAADRSAETAYLMSGADLLAFSRAFSTDAPPRVIYHSHPNGRAYFSDTDREVATSPWQNGPVYPVQQLVVGLDAQRVVEAALFAWSEGAGGFVEVARYPGADI